ncbi:MAG: hypothetical protein CMP38_00500 [Rickettsiales bacterium]|nr:hypothetical protein [Rickettsiales bacterium]|tara:strand:- start:307 stop:1473 length:1167 start_codon:yes stop_codon:yes gene_type:complete
MKKINFFYSEDQIILYSLFPIFKNKKKLKDLGYEVSFYKKICLKLFECQYLIIFSKSLIHQLKNETTIFTEEGKIISFLKTAKKRVNKLIWFDSSDSTSVTHFEVMPYIDLYLKKQIFKNKNLYQRNFYGGRIFSDFYHKKFKVKDEIEFKQFYPLKKKYFKKLNIAWNIGLGNVFETFNKTNIVLRRFFPFLVKDIYKLDYHPFENKRFIDLMFRGSLSYSRNTIKFHRELIYKNCNEIVRKEKLVSVVGSNVINHKLNNEILEKAKKRLSIKEYMYIMRKSKISISPFGWGEIGARDFESIVSGSLLFKPHMNHMLTWPKFFVPFKTYIPLKWDFSDLDRRIKYYLNNYKISKKISMNAQNKFRKSVSKEGMNEFCNHFIKQINLD